MLAILLLTIFAFGGGLSYFASKFWNKTVILLSFLSLAAGISLTLYSVAVVNEAQAEIIRMHEKGDFGPPPHATFDSLYRWVDPYFLIFAGIVLSLFALAACLGCGVRNLTKRLRV